MSIIAPPVRGKTWVGQVTALCVILGMLLAMSLKTQRQAIKEGEPTPRAAVAAYRIMKVQNDKLERELADTKIHLEKVIRDRSRGRGNRDIQRLLDETKMIAGTVAVHGPGIVITLRDSPKKNPAETRQDVVNDYIVHDRDIREVVNELFASGAEAVSVNGQRLIATSSIRCVGPVVLVNSIQTAPPYLIKAIGKPDVLEKALELPMGVADGLFLLDMIEIGKESDIVIPAYTGSTRFGSARPAAGTD